MDPVVAVPGVHEHLLPFYPNYNYREPAPGVIADYRKPNNACGHIQRAFSTWWALRMGGPMDLGLDIGSHRGLTPFAIHIDRWYDNENEHPIYGGKIPCDAIADGGALLGRFPRNTFPFIVSNHSLEHMPVADDAGAVQLLADWISLLRQGGVLALVVPDNSFFDVLGSDRDHKSAWCSGDLDWRGRPGRNFRRGVLEPLLARGGVELVEFGTLDTFFSFQVVLRRTA